MAWTLRKAATLKFPNKYYEAMLTKNLKQLATLAGEKEGKEKM